MIFTLVLGAAAAACVSFLAARAGALTLGGAAAATVVGGLVFAAGGLGWCAILILFFVSSSALSRLPGSSPAGDVSAKSDQRDAVQVLANGGSACLFALLALPRPSPLWLAGFAGSIAAATADTWATEIGSFSGSWPVSLVTLRRVRPGTSGGVTLRGLLAALSGSLSISMAAWMLAGAPAGYIPPVALAGFAASLIDSLLGATVQEVRYCPTCRTHTEQPVHRHCGTDTYVTRGVPGLDNDAVNAIASFSGALLSLLLCIALPR